MSLRLVFTDPSLYYIISTVHTVADVQLTFANAGYSVIQYELPSKLPTYLAISKNGKLRMFIKGWLLSDL